MRNGIIGSTLDLGMPFATQINASCVALNFFPYVMAALQKNETGGQANPATVVSSDNGHGVFQITPSAPRGGPDDWWPAEMWNAWDAIDWTDPRANCDFAIKWFLLDAEAFWQTYFQGPALVRAMAVDFNAGRSLALKGHAQGNIDAYDTDNYGLRAMNSYNRLVAHEAI